MSSHSQKTLQGVLEKGWARTKVAAETIVKRNLVVGIVYSMVSLGLILAAALQKEPDQRFPRDFFWRMFCVGLVGILPPIWFVVEYGVHDSVTKARDPEEKRARLDRLRTYQEFVSKLWIAFSAALVFLYFSDYPKTPSSPPEYTCIVSDAKPGATVKCTPEANKLGRPGRLP